MVQKLGNKPTKSAVEMVNSDYYVPPAEVVEDEVDDDDDEVDTQAPQLQ